MNTPRPIPPHGSTARYAGNQSLAPCRCDACRKAAVRLAAQCFLDRLAGNPRRIPAEPVWEHILELRSTGLTDAEIARAAELPRQSSVGKIGNQRTVGRDIAKAVLSVPVGYWPEGADVPAVSASRRVQALMVLGHTGITIAELAHTEHWRIFKLTSGKQERINPALDTAIRAIYDQLRHTPGDCPRIATIAAQNGWHGPDAWDDIDDPTEDPTAELHLAAREQAKEVANDIWLLASAGAKPEQIAERIGVTAGYVRRRLRIEHPALLLELTA